MHGEVPCLQPTLKCIKKSDEFWCITGHVCSEFSMVKYSLYNLSGRSYCVFEIFYKILENKKGPACSILKAKENSNKIQSNKLLPIKWSQVPDRERRVVVSIRWKSDSKIKSEFEASKIQPEGKDRACLLGMLMDRCYSCWGCFVLLCFVFFLEFVPETITLSVLNARSCKPSIS